MAKAALRKNVTPHELIAMQFQQLRNDQQSLGVKIAEMDSELNQHNLVIDVLKDLESTRRCFRSIGGVLVERTVGDILPDLRQHSQKISDIIDSLKTQLEKKSHELQEFKERNNVRVRGEDLDDDEDETETRHISKETDEDNDESGGDGKDSGDIVGVLVGQ
ncbi:prefoldin subunit 2-like [Oscarella lobularis]|uniref:prefoldin subunit 2-like n=1 Tax=Oscarella lobularis TaxID=121494 RepID=UPI0033141D9B